MADFNVSVTKNGVIPAVICAGNEQTYGQTILFEFSSDWNDLTKEVIFYDLRGNTVVSWVADGVEVAIPDTVAEYGGDSKFTIRGYTIDAGYIADQLQVTGTIHYTYTAGLNPRMEGKIIPSTLDKFIYTASQYVDNKLQEAKDSGEFNGADGQNGLNGADGQDGADGTSAGFGEPTATAVHIPENAQPYALVTASGSDTAKIFAFEFGIPGSTVRDLHILGHYASLSALQAAVPNPSVGDTYSVGSTTPYTIYVYDGVSGTWANYGPLGDGGGGGGGGTVTIDTSMSSSSTNAVQNKTIKAYVDGLIGDVDTVLDAIDAIIGAPVPD